VPVKFIYSKSIVSEKPAFGEQEKHLTCQNGHFTALRPGVISDKQWTMGNEALGGKNAFRRIDGHFRGLRCIPGRNRAPGKKRFNLGSRLASHEKSASLLAQATKLKVITNIVKP